MLQSPNPSLCGQALSPQEADVKSNDNNITTPLPMYGLYHAREMDKAKLAFKEPKGLGEALECLATPFLTGSLSEEGKLKGVERANNALKMGLLTRPQHAFVVGQMGKLIPSSVLYSACNRLELLASQFPPFALR